MRTSKLSKNWLDDILDIFFNYFNVIKGFFCSSWMRLTQNYEKTKKELSMTRDLLTPYCLKSLSKCRLQELRSHDHNFSSSLVNRAITVK